MNVHPFDRFNKTWLPLMFLAGMVIVYTAIIGNWAVDRYMSFNSTLWDMGIMIQAIWNTGHGNILQESVNLGFPISRLAVAHWELIYLPLGVIYRIFPSTPLLLYIQTFILACGVFPIYKFAEKKLRSQTTALLLALAYLCYPALHGSNLFDIHGLTFSTTFLLFTFYYIEEQKPAKTIAFALLSITCREDVALTIFMLGVFSLWEAMGYRPARKRVSQKIGKFLIILGCLWIIAFLARGILVGNPELTKQTGAAINWQHVGGTGFLAFFITPVHYLFTAFETLFSIENAKYVVKLILPVIALCGLSPTVFLIAAPTLLLNLLSNWQQMHQIEYHYTATITPFIFLATINGIANIQNWIPPHSKMGKNHIPPIAGLMIILVSIISMAQFSILRFHQTWHVTENDRILSKKLREIPAEMSVSTTARPGPHLSNRKYLYNFPEHSSDADIIVIELNRPKIEIKNLSGKLRTSKVPAMNKFTRSVFDDSALGLRFVQNNVFCFQRGFDPGESFKKYAFIEKLPAEVVSVEQIDMGNSLFFLGWSPVYISDRQAHFQLYWQNQKKQAKGSKLSFFISPGDTIYEIPYKPQFGRIKIDRWREGMIIRDHLFIDRCENLARNSYAVIAVYETDQQLYKKQVFTFNW